MLGIKKRLMAGVLCVVMASLLAVPASAHHGGRHHCKSQTSVAVCPYDNCTLSGRHRHNGVTYCGYSNRGKC